MPPTRRNPYRKINPALPVPRRGVIRTLVLYFTFAGLGVALGGSGGSGAPEVPASAFSAGGGHHSVLVGGGETLSIDFTVGLPMTGAGDTSDGYRLLGGFQPMREALYEAVTPVGPQFRRGDSNSDGGFDLADGITTLGFLFLDLPISCLDAGDSNDDGNLDLADAIFILGAIFNDGSQPPAPGSENCGVDPTDDALDCEVYGSC